MSGFTVIYTAPKWDCHNGGFFGQYCNKGKETGETEGWVGYIGAAEERGLRILVLGGEAKRSGAWAVYRASLCMCMFVFMHVCVCKSVCVHLSMCLCVCVLVFVFMCICACICLCVYMSACLCVFICEFTEVDWPCQSGLIFQMVVLSVTTLLSTLICNI